MNIPIYMKGQDANLYQDELNQALQDNLSGNGWQTPQQSTANITTVEPDMQNGTLWYDTDTDELKVKIAGIVKVVQVV